MKHCSEVENRITIGNLTKFIYRVHGGKNSGALKPSSCRTFVYSVAGAEEKGPVWERSFEHIFGTSLRNVHRVEYAEYVDSIELILVNCIGIKVPLHSRIRLLGRARTDYMRTTKTQILHIPYQLAVACTRRFTLLKPFLTLLLSCCLDFFESLDIPGPC